MKTKFLALAALAATVGFTACNKESGEAREGIDGVTPTYMAVSFTAAPTGTRATTDVNASEAEAAFKSVDVFIYNPNTGLQVKHSRIAASEFTGPVAGSGSDDWTAKTTAKIATTVGPKTIFVGVNLSAALSAALDDVPMSEFTTTSTLLAVADITGLTDGFAMFSTAPKSCTLVADASDPANNPKIKVQRLVAKVTVEEGAAIVKDAPGVLSDIQYTLNNTNGKTFLVQPADKKDHNWLAVPDNTALSTDYVAVNAAGTAVKSLVARYCLENTSKNYLMGQITRATVRAKFAPATVKVFKNGTDNTLGYEDQAYAGAAKTFYSVIYNNGANKAFFFDLAVATAYAADNLGQAPVTYTDAYCYWDMFLNPDNQYDVMRNDYYRCTITKIVAPGRPTAEVTDPDLPPAAMTDILVDIEMLYWNPITKDYILEP